MNRILKSLLILATGCQVSIVAAEEIPLSTILELFRADLKVEKVEIVSEVMNLSDEEADAFWGVFRGYDDRMTTYWEARLALIESYAANFDSLSDEIVEELAEQAVELETMRYSIRIEYFARMKAATSANTALRFFQLEEQLQSIANIQISSQLPFFPKRPTAGEQQNPGEPSS